MVLTCPSMRGGRGCSASDSRDGIKFIRRGRWCPNAQMNAGRRHAAAFTAGRSEIRWAPVGSCLVAWRQRDRFAGEPMVMLCKGTEEQLRGVMQLSDADQGGMW
jgi:hypothetical protein